jgi:hypothetical protein
VTAGAEYNAFTGLRKDVVLETAGDSGNNNQCDEADGDQSGVLASLNSRNYLTDQHWLSQAEPGAEDRETNR